MIVPPYLQAGDKIAICATARKVSSDEIQAAAKKLEGWGYEVVIPDDLFASENQLAGSDDLRRRQIQDALDDPSIRMILGARGGYGTVRIIDDLDFGEFLKQPKWLVGYSDFSVLLNKVNNLGVAAVHGPMALSFRDDNSASLENLRHFLEGQLESTGWSPHSFNIPGKVKGRIFGGNLSMLYSQLGSETALDLRDSILFFEDLDEYLYHVDRMMMNLKRNSYLDQAKGFVIGGLTDMNDNAIPFGESAEEIVQRHLAPFNKPTAFGAPYGHLKQNEPLGMGMDIELHIQKDSVQIFYL